MQKVLVVTTIVLFSMLVSAQTAKPKPRTPAPSATSKPTKVVGNPKRTVSGLEYWDIVTGTGPTAASGQTVTVHYTGWLLDGKKFDSSVDAHRPFTFHLGAGQVIKGWDEGVAGMKVGGKRQLRIPPDLAYGDQGAGNLIPPGATLIFDVQLLAVKVNQVIR